MLMLGVFGAERLVVDVAMLLLSGGAFYSTKKKNHTKSPQQIENKSVN